MDKNHTITGSAHSAELVGFLKGSGLVALGMGFKVVLTLATEVLAARVLLPERYGLITWGLFLLNIICMVTTFGLNTAMRRFLPMYQAHQQFGAIRGLVRLAGFLSAGGGILGSLFLFFGAGWLALHVLGDERETLVLLTFVLAVPFWNLQKVMLAVFGGFERPFYKVCIEDLMVPLGFLVTVIAAWAIGFKEVGIAGGYVLVYMVSAISSIIAVRNRTPFKDIVHQKPEYRSGDILKFSIPLMFTEPIGKATGLIDVLVIGALSSSYDVGIFRVASDLAAGMSLILMCLGYMYLPMVSRFIATYDTQQWQDMNARVARWSMLAAFPLFATFFFFPGEVIQIVYGPDYLEAVPVLRILAVCYFGHTMVGFTGMNLAAIGMTGTLFIVNFSCFIINIVGNYLLIPIYGIQGAAFMSLFSLWTLNIAYLIIMKSCLSIHPFQGLYIKNLVAILLSATGCYLIVNTVNISSGLLAILLFFCMMACVVCLLYKKGLLIDKTDLELISTMYRRIFSKS